MTDYFDYTFILYNDVFVLSVIMLLFIMTTFYLYHYQTKITRVQSVYATLLLPLSMMNNIYFIMKGQHIILLMICCLAILICSLLILKKCSYIKYLKIICYIISTVLICVFLFVTSISLLFNDFGETKVVQSFISPSQDYKAQVIVSDQGALGGNTYVDVFYIKDDIELLFGKISKHSKQIYEGEWSDYQNIDIYWKSDKLLIINGKEYSIDE